MARHKCQKEQCPHCKKMLRDLKRHKCPVLLKPAGFGEVTKRRQPRRSAENCMDIYGEWLRFMHRGWTKEEFCAQAGVLSVKDLNNYEKNFAQLVKTGQAAAEKFLQEEEKSSEPTKYRKGKPAGNWKHHVPKSSRGKRGPGAGKRKKPVMTAEMETTLFCMFEANRGDAPEQHQRSKGGLMKEGRMVRVTMMDLVDTLWTHHMDHFTKEQDALEKTTKEMNDLLYSRVWWWCKRNDIVYRLPNRTTSGPEHEKMLAQRAQGTLEEVLKARDALEEKTGAKVHLQNLWNIDESALRLLALELKTLAWKGQRQAKVRKELVGKLSLSIFVAWFAKSGKLDLVVVWSKTDSTMEEGDVKFSKEGNVYRVLN